MRQARFFKPLFFPVFWRSLQLQSAKVCLYMCICMYACVLKKTILPLYFSWHEEQHKITLNLNITKKCKKSLNISCFCIRHFRIWNFTSLFQLRHVCVKPEIFNTYKIEIIYIYFNFFFLLLLFTFFPCHLPLTKLVFIYFFYLLLIGCHFLLLLCFLFFFVYLFIIIN